MGKRKINIGAGKNWFKEGWESLESGRGPFSGKIQHIGKAWKTKLDSNSYDLLFAGNIIEHVTHFRIEKTVAEFNRIMKTGGIVRITTPDLKKAAKAYVENDKGFFKNEKNNKTGHIGIGGQFINNIVSPGHDVVLLSSDFHEMIGFYAHTYAYDFEMLKIYLEKWGFSNVKQSSFNESSVEEMQEEQHALIDGKRVDVYSTEVAPAITEDPRNNYISGFDSFPHKTLYVEAEKAKDVPYQKSLEFEYNQRCRKDGFVNSIKRIFIYAISVLVDFFFIDLGIYPLAKKLFRKK